MTARQETHSFASGLRVGIRSVRAHPFLAGVVLAATLSQGTLQGLIVWALRGVLLTFGQWSAGARLVALGAAAATNLARRLLETVSGRLWTYQMGARTERLQPVQV